jgi:hypothetical protein
VPSSPKTPASNCGVLTGLVVTSGGRFMPLAAQPKYSLRTKNPLRQPPPNGPQPLPRVPQKLHPPQPGPQADAFQSSVKSGSSPS